MAEDLMTFRIRVRIDRPELIPGMVARLLDFTPAFEVIRDSWREMNKAKFDKARDQEEVGVGFDYGIFWQPVTDEYHDTKMRQGYDDWLMVKDGALLDAMTEEGAEGWSERLEPTMAAFGVDQTVVPQFGYNFEDRPVAFLDATDRLMIQKTAHDHIQGTLA